MFSSAVSRVTKCSEEHKTPLVTAKIILSIALFIIFCTGAAGALGNHRALGLKAPIWNYVTISVGSVALLFSALALLAFKKEKEPGLGKKILLFSLILTIADVLLPILALKGVCSVHLASRISILSTILWIPVAIGFYCGCKEETKGR